MKVFLNWIASLFNCWLFHRHGKWGKIESATAGSFQGTYARLIQTRECSKCGKLSWRSI